MKILFICNGSGLSETLGGSLVRSIEVLKRFPKKAKLTWITTIGAYKAAKKFGLKIQFHLVPCSIFNKSERFLFDRVIAYIISTIFSFKEILQVGKHDIVCTYSDEFCDIFPAVVYKLAYRTPWVAMSHHKVKLSKDKFSVFLITLVYIINQRISYLLMSLFADRILLLNTLAGRDIGKHFKNDEELLVYVEDGVDLKKINCQEKIEKMYDICMLGGLRPNKGLYDIVPILRYFKKTKKDFSVIHIGSIDKAYKKQLTDELNKENLSNSFIFAGFVSESDKIKILKQSKIFMFPSRQEGFGIAILEAMACGLPVVSWDLDVYKNKFEKGIVKIKAGRFGRFADAMHKLLNKKSDYNKLKEEGISFTQKYSWDKIADDEYNTFLGVIKNETTY